MVSGSWEYLQVEEEVLMCVFCFGWIVEDGGLMGVFAEKPRIIGGLDGFDLNPFERRE